MRKRKEREKGRALLGSLLSLLQPLGGCQCLRGREDHRDPEQGRAFPTQGRLALGPEEGTLHWAMH